MILTFNGGVQGPPSVAREQAARRLRSAATTCYIANLSTPRTVVEASAWGKPLNRFLFFLQTTFNPNFLRSLTPTQDEFAPILKWATALSDIENRTILIFVLRFWLCRSSAMPDMVKVFFNFLICPANTPFLFWNTSLICNVGVQGLTSEARGPGFN